MNQALESEIVIGEMFSGDEHTTNPKTWINPFKERKYRIFSFILKASKEVCHNRCVNDKSNKRHESNRNELQNIPIMRNSIIKENFSNLL